MRKGEKKRIGGAGVGGGEVVGCRGFKMERV